MKYRESLTNPPLPDFQWQPPDDEADRLTYRHILEYGCSIKVIGEDEGLQDLPYGFSYSLGIYLNLRHPEFVILGLPGKSAGNLINRLVDLIEAGHVIAPDDTVTHDFGLGPRRLVAKLVPLELYESYFGYGIWFYRSLFWQVEPIGEHKFPVLQLVWPDADGRYPWQPDCHPDAIRLQKMTVRSTD